MSSEPVTLEISEPVRETLATMLRVALDLRDDDQPVDHLPIDPWGDVDQFRREFYLPIHGEAAVPMTTPAASEVAIPAGDLTVIRDVFDALAESVSGGVPWTALTRAERQAVTRLTRQVCEGR